MNIKLSLLFSLCLLSACSTQAKEAAVSPLADTEVAAPVATVAKSPLAGKLYKIHIAECSVNPKTVDIAPFADKESICRQIFDKGTYVWGKPGAVGILYHQPTSIGNYNVWVKNTPRPTNKMWMVEAKVFIESEGCDVFAEPSGKRGFYPLDNSGQLFNSWTVNGGIDQKLAVYVGAVEEVSELETERFIAQAKLNYQSIKKEALTLMGQPSARRVQQCYAASKLNIRPQQRIGLADNGFSNNQPQIMRYTKSW